MEVQVIYLKTFREKSLGLINKKNINPVYFKTRFGIHTFGMLCPIDVLILDENFKIIKIRKDLKPNRIYFWNPKYFNVLELPAGYIFKNKLKIGDRLTLQKQ